MRQLMIILQLVVLEGCFPLVVPKQPAVEFQVADESGQPIEGAEVHFVRYSIHPFQATAHSWPMVLKTDGSGRAAVEKRGEWQVVILVPDAGVQEYDWAWCIRKDPYAPVSAVGIGNSLDSEPIKVTLKGRNEGGGCAWSPEYRGGRFVADAP